jgi:hypothetical protein
MQVTIHGFVFISLLGKDKRFTADACLAVDFQQAHRLKSHRYDLESVALLSRSLARRSSDARLSLAMGRRWGSRCGHYAAAAMQLEVEELHSLA